MTQRSTDLKYYYQKIRFKSGFKTVNSIILWNWLVTRTSAQEYDCSSNDISSAIQTPTKIITFGPKENMVLLEKIAWQLWRKQSSSCNPEKSSLCFAELCANSRPGDSFPPHYPRWFWISKSEMLTGNLYSKKYVIDSDYYWSIGIFGGQPYLCVSSFEVHLDGF